MSPSTVLGRPGWPQARSTLSRPPCSSVPVCPLGGTLLPAPREPGAWSFGVPRLFSRPWIFPPTSERCWMELAEACERGGTRSPGQPLLPRWGREARLFPERAQPVPTSLGNKPAALLIFIGVESKARASLLSLSLLPRPSWRASVPLLGD